MGEAAQFASSFFGVYAAGELRHQHIGPPLVSITFRGFKESQLAANSKDMHTKKPATSFYVRVGISSS